MGVFFSGNGGFRKRVVLDFTWRVKRSGFLEFEGVLRFFRMGIDYVTRCLWCFKFFFKKIVFFLFFFLERVGFEIWWVIIKNIINIIICLKLDFYFLILSNYMKYSRVDKVLGVGNSVVCGFFF